MNMHSNKTARYFCECPDQCTPDHPNPRYKGDESLSVKCPFPNAIVLNFAYVTNTDEGDKKIRKIPGRASVGESSPRRTGRFD
jgi:hypothetical protein